MNNRRDVKVFRSDIISLIEVLPSNLPVPLKEDLTVCLFPNKIIDEIDSKSKIGKSYYIQFARIVLEKKIKGEWDSIINTSSIILQ